MQGIELPRKYCTFVFEYFYQRRIYLRCADRVIWALNDSKIITYSHSTRSFEDVLEYSAQAKKSERAALIRKLKTAASFVTPILCGAAAALLIEHLWKLLT